MSEELKAIDWLRAKTISYESSSEELHYALILYNLIMHLQQENQELKELNIAISKGLKKVTAKRNKWRNRYYKVRRENGDQQKEFIEWLEKEIQGQEDYAVSLGLTIDYDIAEYTSGKIDALKESLSKYKEIIGGKK